MRWPSRRPRPAPSRRRMPQPVTEPAEAVESTPVVVEFNRQRLRTWTNLKRKWK